MASTLRKWTKTSGAARSIYTRLMAAVGRSDMGSQNPTYATNTLRCQHQDDIYQVPHQLCSRHGLLLEPSEPAQKSCGPVNLRQQMISPCMHAVILQPPGTAACQKAGSQLSTCTQVIGDWVATHTLDEVLAAMKEARVPCGPILSAEDIYNEPHYRDRGMFHTARPPDGELAVRWLALECSHQQNLRCSATRQLQTHLLLRHSLPLQSAVQRPHFKLCCRRRGGDNAGHATHTQPHTRRHQMGCLCSQQYHGLTPSPAAGGAEVTMPAMLPILSHTPGGTRWAGPDLGHHTEQILSEELRLSVKEIEALREAKAI